MPDARILIRPDVRIDGTTVVVHPKRVNFTNAARVTAGTTDLGQADVRVGFARDTNVTLGTETTVVGAGNTTTIAAGDAVGGGPSVGGNVILAPGDGIGGGADGAVVPNVTATVTLGTALLTFTTVFTRNVQTDTGQTLTFTRQDGTVWATLDSGTGVTFMGIRTAFIDNVSLDWGGALDARIIWSTAQATANALLLTVRTGSAAQGGLIIITEGGNADFDHAHPVSVNPMFIVHSAAASTTQFVSFTHNQTNAVITAGTGNLTLTASTVVVPNGIAAAPGLTFAGSSTTGLSRPAVNQMALSANGLGIVLLDGGTTGETAAAVTQPVNTSGSPTALLITSGAHTTLDASVESIIIDFAIAAIVEFATGALATQRAIVFRAPIYAFVAASVITTAATVAITGAPQEGLNATITNPYAFWVQSGASQFDGALGTTGNITSGADTDRTTTLGRVLIDSRAADIAYLSHFDRPGTSDFALRHTAVGQTTLNASTGQLLLFSIFNTSQFRLDLASGFHSTTATGPAILNEASTAINPTLCPDRTELGSGLGGTSDELDLIVLGTSILNLAAATITATVPVVATNLKTHTLIEDRAPVESTTSAVFVTLASAAAVVFSGRPVLCLINATLFPSDVNTSVEFAIQIDGGVDAVASQMLLNESEHSAVPGAVIVTPTAGSHTIRIRWRRTAGAGTLTMDANDEILVHAIEL